MNSSLLTVQDLKYTYDAVGNIKTITDGVRGNNQKFDYDELNRLTSATGFYCNEGAEECTKTYSYDEIGNITKKGDLTYSYDGASKTSDGVPSLSRDEQTGNAGPHAVTKITDPSGVDVFKFEYDENGNMRKMDQRMSPSSTVTTEYIYDSENRLSEVKKSGKKIAEYTYDGDGGRVKKQVFGKNPNSSLQTQAQGVGFTFKGTLKASSDLPSKSEGSSLENDEVPAFGSLGTSRETLSSICGERMPPELCRQKRIEAAQANTTRYVGSLYEETGSTKTRHIFLGGTRIASVTQDTRSQDTAKTRGTLKDEGDVV